MSGAKETNYGNPTHQPKVMFTFGVNSVCACALVYNCVDTDSLGRTLMRGCSTGFAPGDTSFKMTGGQGPVHKQTLIIFIRSNGFQT